jgi:hypothetical protein
MKNTTQKIVCVLLLLIGLLLLLPFAGKSQTIQYSSAVPHTAGTPSGTPSTFGSWLRYDKTNKVLYRWTGAAWSAIPSNTALSDADYGDITVSSSGSVWNIDSGVVGTAEIATDGVDAAEIAANAVGSSEIAANAVDASELASTAVTPGSYGSATQVSTFTVDSDGRLSFAANVTITGVSGTFVGTQVLTSGTTYTPTAGTNTIHLTLVGGGAGGGGVKGAAASSGAGGGGGSGGTCLKTITSVSGTYTYSIGAGGAGGTGAAPSGGTSGGNTTFVNGGTTYTAYGGFGGNAMTSAGTLQVKAGGLGGIVSTNGDVNGGGQPGGFGITVTAALCNSGHGGSTAYGGGGVGVNTGSTSGLFGSGYGSGGSGAVSITNTNQTGGDGTNGVIIVFEYR